MVVTQVDAPVGRATPPSRLCKLPVFRPVAVRLLSALAQEDVDVSLVTDLLNSDPAFSAEILTLANSPLYARHSRIDTVQRAILCLGLERTRAFTATVAMQGMVSSIKGKAAVHDCWLHSRAAGIIAEFAAPFWRLSPEQAYTAALMHDIGRLGMLAAYPEYPILLGAATGSAQDLLQREQASFSLDHCAAGLWLTRIWGLPEEFREAGSQHHAPVTGTPGERIDLVRWSCLFAEALGYKPAPQMEATPVETLLGSIPAVRTRSQFSLEALTGRLHRELEDAGKVN